MTQEYRNGYAQGLRDGLNRKCTACLAPAWVDASKRQPHRNGTYYTVSEIQKDFPFAKAGSIFYDLSTEWCDGTWWIEDENWKVL